MSSFFAPKPFHWDHITWGFTVRKDFSLNAVPINTFFHLNGNSKSKACHHVISCSVCHLGLGGSPGLSGMLVSCSGMEVKPTGSFACWYLPLHSVKSRRKGTGLGQLGTSVLSPCLWLLTLRSCFESQEHRGNWWISCETSPVCTSGDSSVLCLCPRRSTGKAQQLWLPPPYSVLQCCHVRLGPATWSSDTALQGVQTHLGCYQNTTLSAWLACYFRHLKLRKKSHADPNCSVLRSTATNGEMWGLVLPPCKPGQPARSSPARGQQGHSHSSECICLHLCPKHKCWGWWSVTGSTLEWPGIAVNVLADAKKTDPFLILALAALTMSHYCSLRLYFRVILLIIQRPELERGQDHSVGCFWDAREEVGLCSGLDQLTYVKPL